MTEEIINTDGSRNWQANILLDNVKRLEQERDDLKSLVDFEIQRREVVEQENKELKNIIKIHDSTKYDYYKLMKENEEWHIKYAGCNTANNAIQEENKRYRSALEEIRKKCNWVYECSVTNDNLWEYDEILEIINEVLK